MLDKATAPPYGEVLSQLTVLAGKEPVLKPFIDHLAGIFKWQQEASEAFAPDLSALDVGQGIKRNGKGKPFLRLEDIVLETRLFNDLVVRIGGRALASIGMEPPDAAPAADADTVNAVLKGILHRDVAAIKAAAAVFAMDPGVFTFSAHQAVIPFLEAYACGCGDHVVQDQWLRGQCPVCGGEPFMGILTGEGERSLQCGLCRMEWRFKRVACPFCGNDDQETLSYFFDENTPACRVEVCEKCHGYLKTVDARERIERPLLLVEDAATLHLDQVAREKGYRQGVRAVFDAIE